jgi:hypothetical protein
MFKLICSFFILTFSFSLLAQSRRDLTPSKKRNAFGKRDFNSYRPYGIQLSFGGAYTMTRTDSPMTKSEPDAPGARYQYQRDPSGRFGGFLELGMAHFPTNEPRFKIGQKSFRLISYVDWGLGIKYLSGAETMIIENLDAQENIISTDRSLATFNHVNAYGRFTAHKLFYFRNGHFIDNGLGLNFDYRVYEEVTNHEPDYIKEEQRYSKNPYFQLHYELGYGIKMRRGAYMIPGVQLPVLGMSEWNGGNPSIKAFSSSYWPILVKIKFIWLFKEKSKGCNTGSEEDQKRNKEYMQNR